MTYAVDPGRWSSRNCAVASALVQIASSGTSIPDRCRRALRSRGVYIELFVSSKNGRPVLVNRATKSAAPGMGSSSWTSTPSMSESQARTDGFGARLAMRPWCHAGQGRRRRVVPWAAMTALPFSPPTAVLDDALALLADRRFLALTGAGVSTDSGIPDYRGRNSPARMPMTFSEFVSGRDAQQRYWARSHLGWSRM